LRVWPVPESYHKSVPVSGQPGSFWENRGDRRHAGVDIYAPAGSPILAIDDGHVQSIRPFTSPNSQPYWHSTLEMLIYTVDGVYQRYAELDKVFVEQGEVVRAGIKIGQVGSVLNPHGVSESSPKYIQELARTKKFSMLHFEMFTDILLMDHCYSGGNFFLDDIPKGLVDPSHLLESLGQCESERERADGFFHSDHA
jgi:murein DD-endopeptidase MepM/ murein hydrolase activator NlpD